MKLLIVFSVLLAGCYWPSVKEGLDKGSLSIEKDGTLTTTKGAKDASKKERTGEARQEVSKKDKKDKKDYKVKKTQEVVVRNTEGDNSSPSDYSDCKDTILPPPNFTDSREFTEEEAKLFDCWCSLNPLEKRLRLFIKEKAI